jgi:hypothetical protein
MKIIFEDGESQQCLSSDQRQISDGEVLFRDHRIPKHLTRVWDSPPTYARLVVVRCENIVSGHYIMTASGLKLVASVERRVQPLGRL